MSSELLRLAAACNFHVAIVAPEPSPASLALTQRLRDRVPEMIVLAEGPDEIARLRGSLSGVHAFFLKTSNEGARITRLTEITASADSEFSLFLASYASRTASSTLEAAFSSMPTAARWL